VSVSDKVPAAIRKTVIERDQHCCRICGRWVEIPGLHHIVFRSQGGLDVAENLIVVGWTPGHDCHLTVAHGARAQVFRPLLLSAAATPGVTALQLYRWNLTTDLKPKADL
jgi:5-methylcytosine-specific restriction endonuclease McrA